MSDLAQNLESGFRQYIYPCLTGMAFALVVLLGIVLFFSAYCSACRPRRGNVEWIALRERRTRRGFSLPLHPMERRDALPLLLITVLYAFSASPPHSRPWTWGTTAPWRSSSRSRSILPS